MGDAMSASSVYGTAKIAPPSSVSMIRSGRRVLITGVFGGRR
jgi:hypothetical protein